MTDITVKSGYAAVASTDLKNKFRKSFEESDLVVIIGGLSSTGADNVITVLSEYFTQAGLDVDSNKKIINESGDDGYLIKSGEKYVLVLPDNPESVERMFGTELLKNIDISGKTKEIAEPTLTHKIVFAPEENDSFNKLKNTNSPSIVTIIGISITTAVCLTTIIWIIWYLAH